MYNVNHYIIHCRISYNIMYNNKTYIIYFILICILAIIYMYIHYILYHIIIYDIYNIICGII